MFQPDDWTGEWAPCWPPADAPGRNITELEQNFTAMESMRDDLAYELRTVEEERDELRKGRDRYQRLHKRALTKVRALRASLPGRKPRR